MKRMSKHVAKLAQALADTLMVMNAKDGPTREERARATERGEEALATLSRYECEYGNGADCNSLPQGVSRNPCLPCRARAALAAPTT